MIRTVRPACGRCGELRARIIPVRRGAVVECVACGLVVPYAERCDFTDPRDREPTGWNYNAAPCAHGAPCPARVTPTAYLCPIHYTPAAGGH